MRSVRYEAGSVPDELAAASLAGLRHQARDMSFDRLGGDEQPLRDFRVRDSPGHEQEDVHLPAGDAQSAHLGGNLRGAAPRPRHPLAGPAQDAAAGRGQPGVTASLELRRGFSQPRGGLTPAVAERRLGNQPAGEVVPPRRVRGKQRAAFLGESRRPLPVDRKSTRLNSSHVAISYAVFCLKKKNNSYSVIFLSLKNKKTIIMTNKQ